jgi:predicted NBD/HSP70 family sugar kinase
LIAEEDCAVAKQAYLDQEKIKDSNNRRILHLLMRRQELSKQQIARETGISVPTVANNVSRLIEEGIIEEAGVSESTGGRKPMLVRFLPDARYAFGVDFASNHLTSSNEVTVAMINLKATIRAQRSFDYQRFGNVDGIMSHLGDLSREMMSEHRVDPARVLGLGISLPGTVNERRKVLEMAPNLSPGLGMQDLHFRSYERLFPFPLFVENEANASAFAELVLGIAQDKRNLVYLSVNRGIGAGIVVRGHLYKGNKKRAGQVGHITVDSRGVRCTCGMNDCWELYAGSGALIRNYNARASGAIIDTREFLTRLEEGDPLCGEIWEKYLDDLAAGVSSLLLCYDPHYLVIGGEISMFGELLLEPLKRRVFSRNSFYKADDLEVLLSTLRERAAILGAALLPFQKLFYGNNKVI